MANEVKEITSRDVNFAKWYTDVVKKADLVDYSTVKGSMIIRPYGYAIWENMQRILDEKFKEFFGYTPMVFVTKNAVVRDVNEGYVEYETYAKFLEDNKVSKK